MSETRACVCCRCPPTRFRYPSARMVRVLHLLDADADFQTERGASSLARALGANFSVDTRRLGRGGYRNRAAAVLALRQETGFDLIHAWGPGALTTAAMASSRSEERRVGKGGRHRWTPGQ